MKEEILKFYKNIPDRAFIRSELEDIANEIWTNELTGYNDRAESRVLFIVNDCLDKVLAQAVFKYGKLVNIEQPLNKWNSSIGKSISNNLKDLEEGLRKKGIEGYLDAKLGYVAGSKFVYIRVEYSENITEPYKISGKVSIKNAPVSEPATKILGQSKNDQDKKIPESILGSRVLDSGEETGDTFNISKQAEFSKDYDPKFLFRFLPDEQVGYNEIHIDRAWIKEAILRLDDELQAIIHYRISPNTKNPVLEAEINNIKENLTYSQRWELKEKAIRELVNIIIEVCEEKELNKTKEFRTSSGTIVDEDHNFIRNMKAKPDKKKKRKTAEQSRKRNR